MSLLRALILAATLPAAALGQDLAGRFDYYILALSWQPEWCRHTGAARGAPECAAGTGRGFTVHGLWPQHEEGWPQYCETTERDPSRRQNAAMADIMGSAGLAAHQWRKHGRCTGLSAESYFAATRAAAAAVVIPPPLATPDTPLRLPPAQIKEAFLAANPSFSADGVTVRCRDNALTEVRICLTRDLEPRDCAPDARRDCRSGGLEIAPLR
jgi:ribonuclease T2